MKSAMHVTFSPKGNEWERKHSFLKICGALRDLVPCSQFKKREKRPWRSANFSKVAGWVFFTFLKLYEWYQIAQSTTYVIVFR